MANLWISKKKKQSRQTCAYKGNNSHIKKTNGWLVNSEKKAIRT